MSKSLGGSSFIYNGNIFDYCYKECVWSLAELCDKVVIAAGGTDGTLDDLINYVARHKWSDKVQIVEITEQMWEEQKGREKLAYFMNIAISLLGTEWCMTVQADECLHERSYNNIREAIKMDADSFICRRFNMWRDPLSHLVVPQHLKPCSDEVIRLAKTKYLSCGDGESIMAPSTNAYKNSDSIEIWHTGYIRDSIKMVAKSRNMIVDIFGMEMDARIGEKFDYRNFPFTDEDIVPVPLPLPKFIKGWLQERYPELNLD